MYNANGSLISLEWIEKNQPNRKDMINQRPTVEANVAAASKKYDQAIQAFNTVKALYNSKREATSRRA